MEGIYIHFGLHILYPIFLFSAIRHKGHVFLPWRNHLYKHIVWNACMNTPMFHNPTTTAYCNMLQISVSIDTSFSTATHLRYIFNLIIQYVQFSNAKRRATRTIHAPAKIVGTAACSDSHASILSACPRSNRSKLSAAPRFPIPFDKIKSRHL